ncbi:unnamed protein product [Caenorhabditis auriculariae]|uniref:Uncharacterized protein n=1 Tax=Caenorhabditis auriculariae TaxID=2777116 RepID=A0A8S1HQV9_9PELO|nr:unnamed protein product [Caenorhabditis auriculariae]
MALKYFKGGQNIEKPWERTEDEADAAEIFPRDQCLRPSEAVVVVFRTMAFYFALLNVSKKEDRGAVSHPARRRRRHSIASVDSPINDYRLLPKPHVLSDDVAAAPPSNQRTEVPAPRDNPQPDQNSKQKSTTRHLNNGDGPCTSRSHTDIRHDNAPGTLARSKRMAFPANENGPSTTNRREIKPSSSCFTMGEVRKKANGTRSTGRGPKREERQGTSKEAQEAVRPALVNVKKSHLLKRGGSPQGSTTSESRRSSGMSNDSVVRRGDSPASSIDSHRSALAGGSASPVQQTAMKLSALSVSSRLSEPRLKKVTFENSPYVISNSFLGDRAVLVRRGSGTAILRMPLYDDPSPPTPRVLTNTKMLRGRGAACGDGWWTPSASAEGHVENRVNRAIERASKPSLKRLLRRRSTSDRNRIMAYRNNGYLNASEEVPHHGSKNLMTVSVDRPSYSRQD